MKGDFGRLRFNQNKQYTVVLEQQGRVALDADTNEQGAIYEHLRRTETMDVIGEYGAPDRHAGFAISVDGTGIRIGRGRYYVAGLLCENPADLWYDLQTYYVDPGTTGSQLLEDLAQQGESAAIQVYLEVWQRLVTALDDPCLREPAIGQADTTCRLQTVWRVVAALSGPKKGIRTGLQEATELISATLARPASAAMSDAVAPSAPESSSVSTLTSCCASMYEAARTAHSGSLRAQTSSGGADCGCQPVASAGYQGLENQLYRVEVHQGGSAATATFKWSRENGSVVAAIQSVSGPNVVVASLGPDANLGFKVGDWVEISDDTYLFGDAPNQPGLLYQIQQIAPSSSTVTMTTTVLSVDTTRNARMRRWDQKGASATSAGGGLSGPGSTSRTGSKCPSAQATTCPETTGPSRRARRPETSSGPPCGSDGKPFQPPRYADVYRAPLACIHYRREIPYVIAKGGKPATHYPVDDCRRLFPTLTQLAVPTTPSSLHVTAINWLNDDVMTFDDLLSGGLAVTFDEAPTSPLGASNFIVTLEVPSLASSDRELLANVSSLSLMATQTVAQKAAAAPTQPPAATTGAPVAQATSIAQATPAAIPSAQTPATNVTTAAPAANAAVQAVTGTTTAAVTVATPAVTTAKPAAGALTEVKAALPIAVFKDLVVSTVLRGEVIVDSSVTLNGNVVTWSVPIRGASLQIREVLTLDELLGVGLLSNLYSWPARVRVKLLGRTFFASGNNGYAYLDGQAFGQVGTATNGGGQRMDLQFPSGNDAKASDFESWFFLYPALDVTDAEVAYTSMTVATTSSGAVGVTATVANTDGSAPTPANSAGSQEVEARPELRGGQGRDAHSPAYRRRLVDSDRAVHVQEQAGAEGGYGANHDQWRSGPTGSRTTTRSPSG